MGLSEPTTANFEEGTYSCSEEARGSSVGHWTTVGKSYARIKTHSQSLTPLEDSIANVDNCRAPDWFISSKQDASSVAVRFVPRTERSLDAKAVTTGSSCTRLNETLEPKGPICPPEFGTPLGKPKLQPAYVKDKKIKGSDQLSIFARFKLGYSTPGKTELPSQCRIPKVLVERESFATLGFFYLQGDNSVALGTPLIPKEKPARKSTSRYFSKRVRPVILDELTGGGLEALPEHGIHPDMERIAAFTCACTQSPCVPYNWLRLSRQETSHHVSQLSYRDRLDRRLKILQTGLEHCHWNPSLLIEAMRLLRERESEDTVCDAYKILLSIRADHKVSATQGEGDLGLKGLIPPPGLPILHPELVQSFLKFLSSSSKLFSFDTLFQNAVLGVEKLNTVYKERRSLRSRFDQSPDTFHPAQDLSDAALETATEDIGLYVLHRFIDGAQWSIVRYALQALAHMDFLRTKRRIHDASSSTLFPQSPSDAQDVATFLASGAPPLGHPGAVDLYAALVRARGTPTRCPDFDVHLELLRDIVDTLQSGIEKTLQTVRDTSSSCAATVPGISWLKDEEMFDAACSLIPSGSSISYSVDTCSTVGVVSMLCNLESPTPSEHPLQKRIQPTFSPHATFFLATLGLGDTSLHYRILDAMGYPFTLCRFSSNHPFYRSRTVSHAHLDLLSAATEGFLRRWKAGVFKPATTMTTAENSTSYVTKERCDSCDAGDDKTHLLQAPQTRTTTPPSPIPVRAIFGFDLSAANGSQLGVTFSFLQRLASLVIYAHQYTLEIPSLPAAGDSRVEQASFTTKLQRLKATIDAAMFERDTHIIRAGALYAAQMLTWRFTQRDLVLVSALVGSLAYLGEEKLSQKLLKHYETDLGVWMAFATFHFAAFPTERRINQVRKILRRYIQASNIGPTGLCHKGVIFLSGWLRLEGMGAARFQRNISDGDVAARVCPCGRKYDNNGGGPIPYTWLQLLCCFAENQFETLDTAQVGIGRGAQNSSEKVNGRPIDPNRSNFCLHSPWCPTWAPHPLRLLKALSFYEQRFHESSGISVASVSRKECEVHGPLVLGEFFATLLAIVVLKAAQDSPMKAWTYLRQHLPAPGTQIPEAQEHNLEMLLDTLLLGIGSSTPIKERPISSLWSPTVVRELVTFTMGHFPYHRRAPELAAQLLSSQMQHAPALTFRAWMLSSQLSEAKIPSPLITHTGLAGSLPLQEAAAPRSRVSQWTFSPRSKPLCDVASFVITELSMGFPCYRSLEALLEHSVHPAFATLTGICESQKYRVGPVHPPAELWDIYITLLYFVGAFGWSLFTGLPKDNNASLADFIADKISVTSQRARLQCPYSKRLWLHALTNMLHPGAGILSKSMNQSTTAQAVQLHTTSRKHHNERQLDAVLEERYLSELELVAEKQIPFYLDPLEFYEELMTSRSPT